MFNEADTWRVEQQPKARSLVGMGTTGICSKLGKFDLRVITSPKHPASYQLSRWIRHFFILLSQLDPTLSLRLQPTTNQDLDEQNLVMAPGLP